MDMAAHRPRNAKAMPLKRVGLSLERDFSDEEYKRITCGHTSVDMDDRWDIYFEEPWLNVSRSWTGFCIYQVRLAVIGNRYKITEAWANRDHEQYGWSDNDYDAAFLSFLIDRILLDRDTPAPDPPGLNLTKATRLSQRKLWPLWRWQ